MLRYRPAMIVLAVLASACLMQLSGACTLLELTGAGFAANAVHILHAYTLFSHNNGSIYLNSSGFEYKCSHDGGWHDFFRFDATSGSLSNYRPDAERKEACARYTFHDVDVMLHNMHYDWFSIDADAARKVWTFAPWVQDELDVVMEELANMPKPTIGFHIRGGDKLSEDVELARMTTQPRDHIDTFRNAYPHVKGGTCVLVGDDQDWMNEAGALAEAALGCKLFSKVLYHVPSGGSHDQETFNHESFEVKCAGTLQFLLDIELMNHADYFVGTTNSGLPHIIDVLRYAVYKKDRATFVDASFRHQDFFSRMMRYWTGRAQQGARRLARRLRAS